MGNKHASNEVRTAKDLSTLAPNDQIAITVNQWVTNNNNNWPNKRVKDYGLVHFTENDRKSWYIRYPFDPPSAILSAPKEDILQQRTTADANKASVITQLFENQPMNPNRPLLDPAKHLVNFMRDKWELPPPELIISITGGAKIFDLTQKTRNAFHKGLVSAAATTDAWVFTGGTYAGVMKEVGDAFAKWRYKSGVNNADAGVPLIGIASWYYTTNYKQLVQRQPKKQNNEENSSIQMSETAADYEKLYRNRVPENDETIKTCPLDPNHTHFLLLDDMYGADNEKWKEKGYHARADLTIQFRAEIERAASLISNHGQSN